MTWTVMRREVDRNVRVAECETADEAGAHLREARRAYPDEDSWIEREGPEPAKSEPALIPQAVPRDTLTSLPTNQIPKARVVSPLARSKPRRVPWQAIMYMLGPTVAAVTAVLLAGAGFCGFFGKDRHSIDLFSAATERVLDQLAAEWLGLAVVVIAVAATYERWFLRRAHVIEGVMTNGEISVGIEGKDYCLASIAPAVPDGTRVPLLWRGTRVVELSKAGAELDANGEVTWDAKAHPYRLDAAWPGAFVGVPTVLAVMVVMARLAFA